MGYECGINLIKKENINKLSSIEEFTEDDVILEYWCSIGRECLDEYFTNNLREIKDTEIYTGIDSNFITHTIEWCDNNLERYNLRCVNPVKSIKNIDSDNEILTTIDGIIVEDYSGEAYSIYGDQEGLYYSKNDDKYWCFYRLSKCLEVIKELTKLNEFEFYFWRSY